MENSTNTVKKGFLENDRLLVCSMLVFYGLCLIGLMAVAFRWLNDIKQTSSANMTATGVVVATQQANATATAISHATKLAQYETIDRFDSNANKWRTGPWLGSDSTGSFNITSGVYSWNFDQIYQDPIMSSVDFLPGNDYVKDYDVYVETKFEETPSGNACSGLMFRKAPLGWNHGGYSFVVCKTGFFSIHYHNFQDGWQEISSQYHTAIQPFGWNSLEILINGSHFIFLINNQIVYETDDDRQSVGGVALMIEVNEPGTKILFDNFGYQSR